MKKASKSKIEAAAKKLRTEFSGQTFASKDDVAVWMKEKSAWLEKQGFPPADIFYILKVVMEKFI